MRLIALVVLIGSFAFSIVSASGTAERSAAKPHIGVSQSAGQGFTGCPLPIPNCLPEYVYDFKKCSCVPRP